MSIIVAHVDLCRDYDAVSALCHESNDAIIVTRDGKADLAVISIEAYHRLTAGLDLYAELRDGIHDVEQRNTRPFDEAITGIRNRRKDNPESNEQ